MNVILGSEATPESKQVRILDKSFDPELKTEGPE